MALRDPETDPAAFLGAELKRARLAAGFSSQDALAARLGFDRSVITKIERGDRAPSSDILAAWCSTCQVADTELFGRLSVLARRAGTLIPTWFEGWLEAERQAESLSCWEPLLVPGLAQTADYAKSLFEAWRLADEEDIDQLVAGRMERQHIFERADPPSLWIIIDEAVIHRRIGSEKVMYDQLTHLVKLAVRPRTTIQVIPGDVGAHVGLLGAFAVANIGGAGIVYMESPDQGQTTGAPSVVAKVRAAFEVLRAEALPRQASRELIMKVAEERWT